MQLYAVQLKAWRRFADPVSLQINGKLIALVGPNEAGKSSVLDALESLGGDRAINPRDVTRGLDPKDLKVCGYFHLEPKDLEAAHLKGPHRVIRTISNDEDDFEIQPAPPARDNKQRHSLGLKVLAALDDLKVIGALGDDEERSRLESLAEFLRSDDDSLEVEDLQLLKDIAAFLKRISSRLPARFRKLGDRLQSQHASEGQKSPSDIAYAALTNRFPRILMFGAADRNLQQEYTVDELANGVPRSLANLADVAGLSIDKLTRAMAEEDVAEIETLKMRANRMLEQRFKETWSQSGVSVSFAVKDEAIDVVIRNQNDRFTSLAERSDGFRQFVALQSFILARRADNPVLLIDEADQHLHYDAQADLMQMLAKQEVAQKVIYTTHSAGCLPEDLGNGVRLVNPTADKIGAEGDPRSNIINRFWGSDEPGFTPLLIGMGATTLAFFPTRNAVIVEGPCEMLLLPTLLREAMNVEVVEFQVVPGLSNADKAILPIAGTPSKGVCYLVDWDQGGRELEKEIKKTVKNAKVFRLQLPGRKDSELEDFVDDNRLIQAANLLASKFSPGEPKVADGAFGRGSKFDALSQRFRESTNKDLLKVDLAYELLNCVAENPGTTLLSKAGSKAISKLGKEILAHFTAQLKPPAMI